MPDTLKPHQIERFACDSSSIKSIGYAEGVCVIAFASGHLYAYQMSPEQHEAFTTAESKGRWYAANVKGKLACDKLTGRCSRCGSEPEILGEPCGQCGAVNVREIDSVHKAQ